MGWCVFAVVVVALMNAVVALMIAVVALMIAAAACALVDGVLGRLVTVTVRLGMRVGISMLGRMSLIVALD